MCVFALCVDTVSVMEVPPRFGQKSQLKVDKQQTSDVTGKGLCCRGILQADIKKLIINNNNNNSNSDNNK